jgi:hypothetical protein
MVQISYRNQVHPGVIDLPKLPCNIRVKATLIARPLRAPVAQKLSRYRNRQEFGL